MNCSRLGVMQTSTFNNISVKHKRKGGALMVGLNLKSGVVREKLRSLITDLSILRVFLQDQANMTGADFLLPTSLL